MRTVKVRKTFLRTLDYHRDQRIASCEGLYTLRATGEHFGLSYEQVRRIWSRKLDTSNIDPPNIENTKKQPALLEDALILCERGLRVDEAARQLGVGKSTLRTTLAGSPRGLAALQRDQDAHEHWCAGRGSQRGSFGPPRPPGNPSWPNRI